MFVCTVESSVSWSSLTVLLQMGHTCNSFTSQPFHVYLRLEEASVAQQLSQPLWYKHSVRGWAGAAGRAEVTPQHLILGFLSAGHSRSIISSEVSGLRCTYSFIFMPFINLPIYFSGTRHASLWLTYCSMLGNVGPEEWELAYSCLINVNKKCRVSFFFFSSFSFQMQSLYYKPYSWGQVQLQGELESVVEWNFILSV